LLRNKKKVIQHPAWGRSIDRNQLNQTMSDDLNKEKMDELEYGRRKLKVTFTVCTALLFYILNNTHTWHMNGKRGWIDHKTMERDAM
jgi:hypothetical protein